jgi:hypothetical protein
MLEVIVRDVGRLDAYPNADDSFRNRVSPWFRAGIVGLYDGGLEVAGRAITGVMAKGVAIPTEDGELLFPGGLVSYDKIVALDWDPDGHYAAPQLYCSFERGVGPYESKDTPVYRYHPDADWYERLEGVKLKKGRRSPRRWWWDWRLHRKIIKSNREFDAHVREERTRTRNWRARLGRARRHAVLLRPPRIRLMLRATARDSTQGSSTSAWAAVRSASS